MEPAQRSASFRELASELGNAVDWLGDLGVRVSNTRIERYHQALDGLASNFEADTLDEFFGPDPAFRTKTATDFLAYFYEVGDICTVYQWLSKITEPDLHARLKKWVNGPLFTHEESERSILPRSIAFELLVAAQLVRVGLVPISFPPADLSFEFGNRRIVVECKRPIAAFGLERRIKEAFKQVETRARSGIAARVRGIVAIDVSKIFNPAGAPIFEVPDAPSVGSSLTKLMDQFVETNVDAWSRHRGTKSIGVLIRVGALMIDEKGNVPVYCQQHGYTDLRGLGSSDDSLSKQLGQRFSGSPILPG